LNGAQQARTDLLSAIIAIEWLILVRQTSFSVAWIFGQACSELDFGLDVKEFEFAGNVCSASVYSSVVLFVIFQSSTTY